MTHEEETRRLLEEIKRSQDAFIAEWRTARQEALAKETELREKQAFLQVETASRQRAYRVQMFIVFALCAFVLWQLTRSSDEPRRASVSAPAK
jgi:hypothetical protein